MNGGPSVTTDPASGDEPRWISRRGVMAAVGGVVGGAAATSAGVRLAAGPAFAVAGSAQTVDENTDGFTARDVTIRHPSGKVGDVTLRPDLSISWDGLNSPPESLTVDLRVSDGPNGGLTTVDTETFPVESDARAGSESGFRFPERVSLFAVDGWNKSLLQPSDAGPGGSGSGSTRKTTDSIRVTVVATLRTTGGASYTDSGTDQFAVTVVDTDPGGQSTEETDASETDGTDETETDEDETETDDTDETDEEDTDDPDEG